MSKNDNVADFSDFKHPPEWCLNNNKDIEFINGVSATSLIRKIYGVYLPDDDESRNDGGSERSVMQYVSMRNAFERLDCIFSEALQHGVSFDKISSKYNEKRFHANCQSQLINHLMLYTFCYNKLNDFHRHYMDYLERLVKRHRKNEVSLMDSGVAEVVSFFPPKNDKDVINICQHGWNTVPIRWQTSSDKIYNVFDKAFNHITHDYCHDGLTPRFFDYVSGAMKIINADVSKLTELYYFGMDENDAEYNYYEKKIAFDTYFLFRVMRHSLAKGNQRVLSMPSFFIKSRYLINVPEVHKKMKALRDFLLIKICSDEINWKKKKVTWDMLYEQLLQLLSEHHKHHARPAKDSKVIIKNFHDRTDKSLSVIQDLETALCPLDQMEEHVKKIN
ncbi:hypothetical protein LPW36_15410 [Jinshanibacter sp. LJY008]|uniref:Uncharacterized protein n=1 Tax=Limnobaculum eriocheiris TaxID=2897391 RepID=A0A9X1MZD6_9GAMM|nr:hypothetical protein [Limnobaculum eriocheiris]MCD1127363.1 hypothetical protein [Limnobaculum eriocheiris]